MALEMTNRGAGRMALRLLATSISFATATSTATILSWYKPVSGSFDDPKNWLAPAPEPKRDEFGNITDPNPKGRLPGAADSVGFPGGNYEISITGGAAKWFAGPDALVPTPVLNVLQIEVLGLAPGFQYQSGPNASGVYTLTAINSGEAISPPHLSVSHNNGELTITWPETATGYKLQSSRALGSEWQSVPSSGNTFKVPAAVPVEFFRLIKP